MPQALDHQLDRQRIDAALQLVVDRLPGDWLLIGGALVAMWLEPRRMTEDIDLVAVRGTGAERLDLLGVAGDLALPVEALNSAADFFVERIPNWLAETEPLRQGARGRILRPTPTLFLLLKLGRLSGTDLDDCLAMLGKVSAGRLPLDGPRVLTAIDELPLAADPELERRRDHLRNAVRKVGP
jgi:hypothetical protein